ncbi:MAG: DNA replication/repair protein RecF [Bacteroidia bacterium]|nr:DNA replication/repair protein RecF [Bacteroidia bacterium]
MSRRWVIGLYFSRLHLLQFRNYTELELHFSPGINCITGPNGAGKTNILDALHYLAFTRGFRSTQDQQAVQEGADYFFDGGVLMEREIPVQIHCNLVRGKGKKLLINQKPLEKMSEHIGRIPMVAVLPDDTALIHGPSADRRRLMDMLISQYDPAYLRSLIRYEHLLAQRNALLKQFGARGGYDREQLALWEAQLSPEGIRIRQGRETFLAAYEPEFEAAFRQIVSAHETPVITYKPGLEDNTPAGWDYAFERTLDKDRALQYTTAGIHRDDLSFSINGLPVRNYGSQGQQKTFVIALRLAQYRLLAHQTGRDPLLLLDDIFDKLDESRLARIAGIVEQEVAGQVFITATSADRLRAAWGDTPRRPVWYFDVRQGHVTPITP